LSVFRYAAASLSPPGCSPKLRFKSRKAALQAA
jgi:hypothetical protein